MGTMTAILMLNILVVSRIATGEYFVRMLADFRDSS